MIDDFLAIMQLTTNCFFFLFQNLGLGKINLPEITVQSLHKQPIMGDHLKFEQIFKLIVSWRR
jgi:hypothetical protein